MIKLIFVFLFMSWFAFMVNAQQGEGVGRGTESSTETKKQLEKVTADAAKTAPIKWERYKVTNLNFSVLLPKLPVYKQVSNRCFEETENKYAVYADGIVYGVNIVSKMDNADQKNCSTKVKFSEDSFWKRLKNTYKVTDRTETKIGGHNFIKLKDNGNSFWLLNDYENKRWVELWTTSNDDLESDKVEEFASSLKLTSNLEGIEIGKGSAYTLGDEPQTNTKSDLSIENTKTQTVNLAFKISANYTDLARQNQIQGVCTLRVTFLANGAIGTISVVSALPDGLTEQAIAVARKIVFIPASKNGVFYTVNKQVQYNFTLY